MNSSQTYHALIALAIVASLVLLLYILVVAWWVSEQIYENWLERRLHNERLARDVAANDRTRIPPAC
jgi:hypothetical protein